MGKEQELIQAIRNNDVALVKKLLAKFKTTKSKKTNKKGGVHIIDPDGFTPLHHAALGGNGEIVMALLGVDNDVNVKDKKGMTPLHLAAWAGKVEPALLLLDAGAETNLCSRSGATPLHLASEHGNYVVVERLVDHDCDPTVVNNKGETALDLACRFGHLEVVRILLNNSRGKCEKLLNPKEFQEKASPLHVAAKAGHCDVVKLLVEAGADVNQKGPSGTCLHETALYGKTEVVKFLIESGIDVNLKNREGETALDIVTKFTKSGASSEIKNLLREASVEVVYAKAITDYCNIKDTSFLTLRLGDIVLVLDRRRDGIWRGCIRDDQKERIGYFPSTVVKVLRSPSRNSVKRSSTSSTKSDTPKVSTVATVSNSFEIVTVTPPSQPVAGKTRVPKMSSFRKKAPKSAELRDRPRAEDKRNAIPLENGGNYQNIPDVASRVRSESELDEKKKKLNYLDIVLAEKKIPRDPSAVLKSATSKTDYAEVWLPKTNGRDTVDGTRTAQTQETKDRMTNGYTQHQQGDLPQHQAKHPVLPEKEACSPVPSKARHYTMSPALTSDQDLHPLPLVKRHSLSGRPSTRTSGELSLSPKLEKKNSRSSFRSDRRGTSPPPPPPPPPISSTPSPVAATASSEATSPPPPIAKSNKLSTETQSRSVVSPPPPPPPPPPPTEQLVLSSPSTSSLADFPPPPPSSMVETPEAEVNTTTADVPSSDADYAYCHLRRHNTCPLSIKGSLENIHGEAPPIGDVRTGGKTSADRLVINGRARGGYEDMTRLTRTKSEVPLDKKGYVLVTPVKRLASPVVVPPPPKLVSSPSTPYENFTPLKMRLANEQRTVSEPVVAPSSGQDAKDPSQQSSSTVTKPEKPSRHRYVNYQLSLEKDTPVDDSNDGSNSQEMPPSSSDERYEDMSGGVPSTPTSLPVPEQPTTGVTNLRMREYDELYDWLAQLKLLVYMDNFASAGFDLTAMAGLTAEDLTEIQITKTGHRKRLLSEASILPQPHLSFQGDVPSWLQHLGLSQYRSQFMDGGFDDIEFLHDISQEDLRAIGITKVGHQRKILMAAKSLEQREKFTKSSTRTNDVPEETESFDEESERPKDNEGTVGGVTGGDKCFAAGHSANEYAVPTVSHYNEIKPGKSEIRTDVPDEFRWAKGSPHQQNLAEGGNINCEVSEPRVAELPSVLLLATSVEGTSIELPVDNTTMNGTVADQDNVDGVKELAASFQHTITEESHKAKGAPPPVKPKSYKKPPPAVLPKPKSNGYKVEKIEQNSTDISSKVDFTNVIKEAEALSESGSESPSSTLGRDHKSENGVSHEGSLNTNMSGSQGSLNSESEEFQREIIESLHHKKPKVSSVEDINKQLAQTLSLSGEDLIEQQKREQELENYQSEQNKTDSLFTDIQGMLDNLSSELDNMF